MLLHLNIKLYRACPCFANGASISDTNNKIVNGSSLPERSITPDARGASGLIDAKSKRSKWRITSVYAITY